MKVNIICHVTHIVDLKVQFFFFYFSFFFWKLDTVWNGSTHTCTYLYQTACALYDVPEDGCILHSKHVEWKRCNKITLNYLHQAGPSKPNAKKLYGGKSCLRKWGSLPSLEMSGILWNPKTYYRLYIRPCLSKSLNNFIKVQSFKPSDNGAQEVIFDF